MPEITPARRAAFLAPLGSVVVPDAASGTAFTATAEELAADRAISRRSLVATAQRLRGALSKRCDEHGAVTGAYCWPGARGLCHARWLRGAGALIADETRTITPGTEQLGQLADAYRAARRDDRLRPGPRISAALAAVTGERR